MFASPLHDDWLPRRGLRLYKAPSALIGRESNCKLPGRNLVLARGLRSSAPALARSALPARRQIVVRARRVVLRGLELQLVQQNGVF